MERWLYNMVPSNCFIPTHSDHPVYDVYTSLWLNIVDRFPKQKYNFTGSENKKVNVTMKICACRHKTKNDKSTEIKKMLLSEISRAR